MHLFHFNISQTSQPDTASLFSVLRCSFFHQENVHLISAQPHSQTLTPCFHAPLPPLYPHHHLLLHHHQAQPHHQATTRPTPAPSHACDRACARWPNFAIHLVSQGMVDHRVHHSPSHSSKLHNKRHQLTNVAWAHLSQPSRLRASRPRLRCLPLGYRQLWWRLDPDFRVPNRGIPRPPQVALDDNKACICQQSTRAGSSHDFCGPSHRPH